MHDPMAVAWDIPSPIARRERWRERGGKRWGFDVMRRTNPANLGQRVYRWWRPKGYTLRLAGRAYGLRTLATIWHVEPKGHDSGEICKHYIRGERWANYPRWKARLNPLIKVLDGGEWAADLRWKWHVHHWHIQIHPLQAWRARLFDRCALCGRKGRPNHSHQWDSASLGWRKWRSREGLYHRECSELVTRRHDLDEAKATMRDLFAMARVWADLSEEELISRLYEIPEKQMSFHRRSQLTAVLGWRWDSDRNMFEDSYVLTHDDGRECRPYDLIRARRGGT